MRGHGARLGNIGVADRGGSRPPVALPGPVAACYERPCSTRTTSIRCSPARPEPTEFRKLRKRIVRLTREAHRHLRDGTAPATRWLVCLSGGKDSYTLLAALIELQVARAAAGRPARLQPRPGPAGLSGDRAAGVPRPHGRAAPDRVPRHLFHRHRQGAGRRSTYCALCSRLRRGNLYRIAREEGCSAVVLGHHRDDILETFLLNLFFGGTLAAMPPKLLNDDGDLHVLRPLAHVAEADCDRFARAMGYPIIPCDLCGSQDGLQRLQVKRMLDEWEAKSPGRRQMLFRALTQVEAEPPARPGALRLQEPLTSPQMQRIGLVFMASH